MNIGLDYDGTITGDPDTFYEIVKLLVAAGHKVWIVTMRFPSENDIPLKWKGIVEDIVFTRRMAKKPACEALGIKINIWIDDNPKAIDMNAVDIWGKTNAEGLVTIVNYDKNGNEHEKMVEIKAEK